MEQNQTEKKCACPHHKVIPILVILLGLVFLLNAWGVISAGATAFVWPIIVILIGLQKLFGGSCKCC